MKVSSILYLEINQRRQLASFSKTTPLSGKPKTSGNCGWLCCSRLSAQVSNFFLTKIKIMHRNGPNLKTFYSFAPLSAVLVLGQHELRVRTCWPVEPQSLQLYYITHNAYYNHQRINGPYRCVTQLSIHIESNK